MPGIHAAEHVARCQLNIYFGVLIAVDCGVKTTAPVDGIISAPALKQFVGAVRVVTAKEGVVEVRAAHPVHTADEGIISDSCDIAGIDAVRRSHSEGRECNRHTGRRVFVAHACIAVACNSVVPAVSFKLIQGTVRRPTDADAASIR